MSWGLYCPFCSELFIFLAATESREPSILAWNRLFWFLEREKKKKEERRRERMRGRERKKEGKVTRWFENRLEVSKLRSKRRGVNDALIKSFLL